MNQGLLVVFPTTHLTLMAEKAFKEAGVKHRTIMKPRKISSDCGLAITLEQKQIEQVQALLKDSGHLPATFYRSGSQGWECMVRLEPQGEPTQ